MKFRLKIKGKEYDVEISETDGGTKIRVGGKEFIFGKEIGQKERISVAKTFFPKRDFSKKEIKAPITGVISKIFIKKGGFIKTRQKLLLLSAMKMENEIISDFEGRVKEVFVKKDQKVKKGEILIVLE